MKKLLLTGGMGFLGRHVKPLLEKQYKVTTCGISTGNDILCDLSVTEPDFKYKYDIVLHAAGKAHLAPQTKEDERLFYDINFQGSINLCNALEHIGIPDTFVYISSIAVYGLTEGKDIDESFPLNGLSPYAKSKIMAEEYLTRWCSGHKVKLSILRPPLIVGSNPPGNLGNMIKGIRTGRYLRIAGGKAKKSVLLAEEIARIIPLLEGKEGVYNLCDDSQPAIRELESCICRQLHKLQPINIPYWMAKCMALIGDCFANKAPINSNLLKKLTCSLTFSNEKAKHELGWQPLNVLENFRI